ncbi:MAG: pyrroline-5-carboxylate reductase [Oscillospiraceae bacterium]|jgi:pyrroline-5-carboxylate reductase|nr:pyrroline-5-carboxylate reductase [Oscillospiraceae bacterium]
MTISFIGAGNMATAIINGILKAKAYSPQELLVFDIDQNKLQTFKSQGLQTANSAEQAAKMADILVLAIKPQTYPDVLAEIKNSVAPTTVIVTIAAGISSDYIRQALGQNAPVVRVMPNTPLLLGCGASALCKTQNVTQQQFEVARNLFACSGITEVLDEAQMNAVIAVNGSSPAYVYLFAKAASDYAADVGIDQTTALRLFCQTLIGSAKMLINSGDTPDELIKKVCSPGGTTIAAMNKLDERGFYNSVKDAMAACTARAEELGK